jgi:hypothetical protein
MATHNPTERISFGVYDIASEQWTTVATAFGMSPPNDMDSMPGGDVLIVNEWGILGLDPRTGEQADFGPMNYPPDMDSDQNGRRVAIDSSSSIITNFITDDRLQESLIRQRPGESTADRYDPEYFFGDYALASDTQLIVSSRPELYELNLETGISELVYERDIVSNAERVLVDSAGRVLVLMYPYREPSQIVRIDLVDGTEGLFPLGVEVWDFDVVPLPEAYLQPGDADQDLSFDQLDLVQVQVAGKYLTGEPATWGEGDWNGGPGWSQGNPPPGDGIFDQLDIVTALQSGTYLTGPYAVMQGSASFDASLAEPALVHVPEPNAATILICGLCLSLSSFRRRQHRPAAECRR